MIDDERNLKDRYAKGRQYQDLQEEACLRYPESKTKCWRPIRIDFQCGHSMVMIM